MATTDTLCFGDADGVTGNPVPDGLIDFDFLPFNMAEPVPEHGYVNGCRLTFGPDIVQDAGAQVARVIFQGVRQPSPDVIAMGFMCRFDPSFDPEDFIVLALQSSFNAGPRRMIVINPSVNDTGVEPGVGDGPNQIKRNVTPLASQIDFFEDDGNIWKVMPAAPPGVQVRLRSWKPGRPQGSPDECAWSVEVFMPRTGGTNWITLNDDFGLYFNVVRVFNMAASAVQSAFPTTATDLPAEPDINFVVPQWGHGLIPAIQIPPGKNLGLGVRFKNGWQGIGRRTLGSGAQTLTSTIEGPGGLSDNEIVAFIENTGNAPADDITAEFRFANWGLGGFGFNLWDQPANLQPNPTPRRVGPNPLDPPVNLAATPQPNMPTSATCASPWLRSQIPAAIVNSPHQCLWVQLSSATGVNFIQSSTRRNMDFVHFSSVERDAEISGEGYPEPADGSGEHDFLLETFCRQINLYELVKEKDLPEDELKGIIQGALEHAYDRGPNDHPSTVPPKPGKEMWTNSVVYFWITLGYRRTGTFIKIKGRLFENLDRTPGEFGLIAHHPATQDKFSYSFQGPGVVQYAPGVYGVKVPHKGKTVIKVKVGADGEGPAGDRSELPRAPWPKPEGIGPGDGYPGHGGPGEPGDLPKGCLALLMRLLGLGK